MIITTVRGKPVWKKTDGDYYIFYTGYKIYSVVMSGPFIVTDFGFWIVGRDVTDDASVGIASEKRDRTTPPRSGWEYRDGCRVLDDDYDYDYYDYYGYDITDWVLDDTLLFLPGGPGKEL